VVRAGWNILDARPQNAIADQTMRDAKRRLIVALDVPGVDEARALVAALGDSVGVYKIGLQLMFSGGFALAQELAGHGHSVFVDAKLLDIEATVERATAAVARTGARFLTVHALDRKTLEAAVHGRGDSALKLLGVTVLTNLSASDLVQQGIDHPLREVVLHRAKLTKEAGFDGVIASGHEAASVREAVGSDFLIVTPGVRPQGTPAQDQARAVTPRMAIEAGADYLVVGRPITRAGDPRIAAETIVAEIEAALSC
jgi:orotidine-5'-phosphate decarboxylase